MLKLILFFFCFISSVFASDEKTKPYNIILIINDQETHTLLPAPNYVLNARAELAAKGVTFENHYAAAAMCSPSRASFLTGTPPQINGVFDQMGYKFVPSLPISLPNMGSMIKSLGYQTAYFGKFEMDKALLHMSDKINSSTLIQQYGFDVFNPDGDLSGNTLDGYKRDAYYVGRAVRYLRKVNTQKADQKKPFFMVVSLLNPHDIMYGDANLKDQPVVQKGLGIAPPPVDEIYNKRWQFTLPSSLTEDLKAKGEPQALLEYLNGWSGVFGTIPNTNKTMWQQFYNYYLNTLRDNDLQLKKLLTTFDELGLWQNTIIVLTADHGEMGGAHGGLRGKGPFVYEQNAHIPLIIYHPDGAHGKKTFALTSHLDLLPTLVHLTNVPSDTIKSQLSTLKGRDFSSLVFNNGDDNLHKIRPGILFNYVGVSTLNASYLESLLFAQFKGGKANHSLVKLTNRGFLVFVFDGRYKYGRYYSPKNINEPKTIEEIFANNDVQLFDLQNDPGETNNLALDKEHNETLILRMNGLLNLLWDKEVGVNNDQYLAQEFKHS